ncbi:MAG: glycine cleavage system protein GcvH [Bdellovibrionales bacterium]|nr:glycine cleavage system protein GcvH [Bdellovibrionales bacterium]
MNFPGDLKYTKDHEWAKVEGNQVTVGVSDHAQSSLGDVVFVDLPKVGRELKVGEVFGVVESIKAVSDLYSPVAGRVTAVNGDLANEPSKVNQDPYGSAWLVKMELTDPSSLSSLMSAKDYQAFVASLG